MMKTTWVRLSLAMGAVLGFAVVEACSVSSESGNFMNAASGGVANVFSGGSSSGATTSVASGGMSITIIGSGGAAGASGTAVPCTEGEECNCPKVTVALLGKPGQFGDKDSTAFMTWLNSSSSETAKVDSYTERTPLTAEFLAPYNVIILLGLGDDSDKGPFWKYDASELAALEDWVVNKGGGLISLSGASGQPGEVDPNNQLMAFSQIAYVPGSWITPDCLNVDANNSPKCGNCCGNAAPISAFNKTDPVVSNLANSITWVGMHGGRSITAPTDAHVAATIVTNNTTYNVIVGKVMGAGRILAFTDEWITYTSQWRSTSNDPSCAGYLPQDVYQTAQFWFNMIKWVQPKATCFKIVDPQQTVVLW